MCDPLSTCRPVIFHASCSPFSDLDAIESRHDVKAHIDACGDACRGDDMSLIDDACIGDHIYCWIRVAHPLDAGPVCGCLVMVEQIAFSKQESSCTDACCQICALNLLNNPVK